MDERVLLFCEDKSNLEFLFSDDINVLRRNEVTDVVSISELKCSLTENVSLILIDEKSYSLSEILKAVEAVKRTVPDALVVLILSKHNDLLVKKCCENGIFDFINYDSTPIEFNIRLLNYLKFIKSRKKLKICSTFLSNTSSLAPKTGLFTYKSLKENYDYIRELPLFKSGSFVVLTIDSSVKTRVSMNRLGQNLKKYLRETDIIAQGSGKFYLLLPNTNVQGAKVVVEKVDYFMGKDIKIRAGIASFGGRTFYELEKDANDSLKSAIVNDALYASLGKNIGLIDEFTDSPINDKHFKLFEKIFNKKLKELIEPMFFRTEKEFQAKLGNILVNQYANKVECVFSLKSKDKQSELVMRYDGFAKFSLKIIHKGLDTCENTQVEIPLNELNEKVLAKYLKLLYTEFSQ